ncbi:MAG: phosphodiester glycosidase family protein [Eubacteriales bacterium]|nr:phosphodiester glycosidase family protein [Eubacteriales bacterium]MDD3881378.1 phosphodiester glycosidase family protein [Eubacteriales bacterium]MDD4513065.1 phosphodiester glycosidase family protein [Eubacteriales bacterium]
MKKVLETVALVILIMALALCFTSPVLAEEEEAHQPPVLEQTVSFDVSAFTPLELNEDAAPYVPSAAGYLPDKTGYEDASIKVTILTDRAYDTNIMIALIDIASPTQLRTYRASLTNGKATRPASALAKRANAVAACNGDFYTYSSGRDGFIYRAGEMIRDNPAKDKDVLIIDSKGDMHIIVEPTDEAIAAYEGDIVNAFSFGPGLIIDGEKRADLESSKCAVGPLRETQRIAFCQRGELSYAIVATEGPENKKSTGLTIFEFQNYLYSLGVQQAFNLDGGSSSTVVLNNEKINALSSHKVRYVYDIIYFATLVDGEAK